MAIRNYAFLSTAVLTMLAVGCSQSKEDSAASSDMAMTIDDSVCNIHRGAFVSRSTASPTGDVKVSCPGTQNITFNGQPVTGKADAFTVQPKEGVNILHVENRAGANDIAFLYGTFADPHAVTNKAISIHLGASGLTAASLPALPLPAGPTNVTLSQIATQILRDQGNLLATLDGKEKDVGGAGFGAAIKIDHSSYNSSDATLRLSARDGGFRLEAILTGIVSKMDWNAHAPLGVEYDDSLTVMVDKVHVTADIDVVFDASGKALKATLGGHTVEVSGVDLDDQGLDRIPFGIGEGIQDAIATGAEFLVNHFGDTLIDAVKGRVLPPLSVSLNQFHLPSTIDVPFLGGQVDLKEDIDGASFKAAGSELSLAAAVLAPKGSKSLPSPGWLTHPASSATWDPTKSFGVSLSVDYVNQALFSVWSQGLLNRQLVDHLAAMGISTGPVVSDAKLPPVLLPAPEGDGVLLNLGELQLDTVYHAQSGDDAKVRLGVSLVTKAKVQIQDGGASLKILPSGDDTSTLLSAQLIAVEDGKQAAADELSSMLQLFTPYLQTLISNDIDLPPIAIPSVDLGIISPSFSGREGRFDGSLKFDPQASRIVLEGDLVAQ